MSIQHCFNCDREIDTDFDCEHFDVCGKEEIETIVPIKGKRIYNKWYKEIWWWLQEKVIILLDKIHLIK